MDDTADRYDPIFNIEDKSVAELYLSPWTHSELRDLLIIPLLAVSFLWTCGVLYLLLARRSSPFNTMWPSRALLVVVAFGWQASFAITTGRAQMTAFGISSQDQCRLFIFADFAVFEPWFCLILVFSLNIRWPTCITGLLRLCACCYAPRCGIEAMHVRRESNQRGELDARQVIQVPDSGGVHHGQSFHAQRVHTGQDTETITVRVDVGRHRRRRAGGGEEVSGGDSSGAGTSWPAGVAERPARARTEVGVSPQRQNRFGRQDDDASREVTGEGLGLHPGDGDMWAPDVETAGGDRRNPQREEELQAQARHERDRPRGLEAGGGSARHAAAAGLIAIEKEGGAGGFYYLTPGLSMLASVVLLTPSVFFHLAWYRVVALGKEWPPMRLQVGGPCATWFGHLLGTAVYLALTILMLHINGRTLASLAINQRVRRRLFWMRVRLSMLLIMSFLLRFMTVFYKDLSSSDINALFLAYFAVVVITCNLSVYSLIVRPLMGNLKPWAWAWAASASSNRSRLDSC